jgi:transcription initiation factor TFIID TATA-box-binding protein
MTDVCVENIIVSFSVATSLDLQKLSGVLTDATFNPDDTPALVMQFAKPKSVVTLFSTGNVMMTGPKTMEEVQEVTKMLSDRLSIADVHLPSPPEVHVQNITASVDLGRSVDLRFLKKSLKTVEYNPKKFPGLIYTGDNPNTVILVFDSGKIVCNGPRLEEVTVAIDSLIDKLVSFGIRKEEHVCQK